MLRTWLRRSPVLLLALPLAAPAGAGEVELVSRVHPRYVSDTAATGSWISRMSADGRFVAFASSATDLVENGPVDDNDSPDIFLYDRVNGTTELLSDPGETVHGDTSTSRSPVLSADGRYVAFVTGDKDAGAEGDKDDESPALLPDFNVFLYDRLQAAGALSAEMSANGQWISWGSFAKDLVSGARDTNGTPDLVLEGGGERILVSLRAPDMPSVSASGWNQLGSGSISADGRFVTFVSTAPLLVAGQRDRNGGNDVFLHDRLARTTTLVSRSAAGPAQEAEAEVWGLFALSGNGEAVAFASVASDLVPDDHNLSIDIFVYDSAR